MVLDFPPIPEGFWHFGKKYRSNAERIDPSAPSNKNNSTEIDNFQDAQSGKVKYGMLKMKYLSQ